jgi:hypothetical protein
MSELMNEKEDIVVKFMNKVIAVSVSYRDTPIRGKLIQATKDFILLERVNRDIGMIRIDTILGIVEAHIHKMRPDEVI